MYTLKIVKDKEPMAKVKQEAKKSEHMLKDLLAVMPTLKKHKMEGDIQTKIRTLRNGRKQKHHTLELSRKFLKLGDNITTTMGETTITLGGQVLTIPTVTARKASAVTLSASAPLVKGSKEKPKTHTEVLKNLKQSIIDQIKEARKSNQVFFRVKTFEEGLKANVMADEAINIYLEAGNFLKLQSKRVRLHMSDAKTPNSKTTYVSIELEMAALESRETICDVLFEAGVGKHVHVKRDASIETDPDHPNQIEIAVLMKESEFEDVVTKLCHALNTKLHVKVNKSCGLHVHLDMRNCSPQVPFSNLVMMQHILYGMLPAARKINKYAVPIKDKKMGTSKQHYDGISASAYDKYKTIEVRVHNGTTQATKIINWIKLLRAVAYGPSLLFNPKSVREVQSFFNIPEGVCNYVESRIAKFASQHEAIDKKHASEVGWLAKVDATQALPDIHNVEEQSEVA